MRHRLPSKWSLTRQIRLVSTNQQQQQPPEIELKYLLDSHPGVAVIALNRPKAKNSFGNLLTSLFVDHLESLKYDKDTRVLIIRSLVPGVFCVGADLKERAQMPLSAVGPFVGLLRSLVGDLHDLNMPTIAAIDGYALGGGLEMALAADMRVASSSAKMGLVETTLAIIPGAGGTQRLPRMINPAVAKELIFTGRTVDGTEAHRLGIVNHVVDQNDAGDAAYQKALSIAKEITVNGPIALRMAKTAVNRGLEVDLNSGLAIEQLCYAQVIPTKDRVEGLTAFKEKRKPRYLGE